MPKLPSTINSLGSGKVLIAQGVKRPLLRVVRGGPIQMSGPVLAYRSTTNGVHTFRGPGADKLKGGIPIK